MDHAIAWPALITGIAVALACASALVALRTTGHQRTSTSGSWQRAVTFLALALLLLFGTLLAFWALNLRGTLGR